MAAINATAFPLPNGNYRVYGVIKSLTTGNSITGGLAAPFAATISIDGGNFAATTNPPVEIQTTGKFYIELTAAEMNGTAVFLSVTANNAGAMEQDFVLLTSGVAQITGAVPTATVNATAVWSVADFGDAAGRATNLGGQIAQIWRYFFNVNKVDKNAQTRTLCRDDSTTILVSGMVSANDTLSVAGKLN